MTDIFHELNFTTVCSAIDCNILKTKTCFICIGYVQQFGDINRKLNNKQIQLKFQFADTLFTYFSILQITICDCAFQFKAL